MIRTLNQVVIMPKPSQGHPHSSFARIKIFRSSSITLAIIFTLLLLCSIATLLYFMRLASDGSHQDQISASIYIDTEGFHDAFERGGIDLVADLLQYRVKHLAEGRIYALANSEGHVMMGNFGYIPSGVPKEGTIFSLTLDAKEGDHELPTGKAYDILALYIDFPDGHRLLVGRNLPDIEFHEELSEQLGWAMIIVMFALAGAGFFIGERVVYRINVMADTASYIMQTGDLSKRIPILSQWDDLSKLGMILNELLGRVGYLMEEVRATSDNIAHDLRTPLTRMKHHIETLHQKAVDDHIPITEVTDKLLDDMDHVLQTFSALLRIRNLEAGTLRLLQDEISLSALLQDVYELYEPTALEKEQNMTLDIRNETIILGDKHLLFQAFANIIDNAIKYAPNGARIQITLYRHGDDATIIVHNSGTHVEEALQEKIFLRFFRTDNARTSRQGTGLGLSLSKAIIERHGGTVRAYNSDDGFAVSVSVSRNKKKAVA
ncbi:MAG: sensor histidine kinase [Alphaproteobacteria bacterium]|nr:MAG: sensor histidine kinase [Alphaproteobacteria bacterium]TAF74988.1 MAG: sensor histidine kinase [Alphaproteobacteria bacterium]